MPAKDSTTSRDSLSAAPGGGEASGERCVPKKGKWSDRGSFATLPTTGTTYYVLEGPSDGELVMFFHGFTVNNYVWRRLAEMHLEKGHRILAFDTVGFGRSSCPKGLVRFSEELFVRQARELLEHLGLESQPVTLVGSSMGGVVATGFCVSFPHNVRRLVLVACGGLKITSSHLLSSPLTLAPRALYYLGATPLLGKLAVRASAEMISKVLPKLVCKKEASASGRLWSHLHSLLNPLMGDTMKEQVDEWSKSINGPNREGYLNAIYETLQSYSMYCDRTDLYTRLAELQQVEVLLVWGNQDNIVPLAAGQALHKNLPRSRFVVVDGCGHGPHFESPHDVFSHMQAFYQGSRTAST